MSSLIHLSTLIVARMCVFPVPLLWPGSSQGQCGVFLLMMISTLDILALVLSCPK
jgi:hypothetical protein